MRPQTRGQKESKHLKIKGLLFLTCFTNHTSNVVTTKTTIYTCLYPMNPIHVILALYTYLADGEPVSASRSAPSDAVSYPLRHYTRVYRHVVGLLNGCASVLNTHSSRLMTLGSSKTR